MVVATRCNVLWRSSLPMQRTLGCFWRTCSQLYPDPSWFGWIPAISRGCIGVILANLDCVCQWGEKSVYFFFQFSTQNSKLWNPWHGWKCGAVVSWNMIRKVHLTQQERGVFVNQKSKHVWNAPHHQLNTQNPSLSREGGYSEENFNPLKHEGF